MAGRWRRALRVAGVLGGVVGCTAASVVVTVPAVGAPMAVDNIPDSYRKTLVSGARACPEVPLSVLTAQLEVASGFRADAVTEDGGRGIAAFTPNTWSVWGEDADGDGLTSAFDVADAIDAQARRMCWLYGMARDSHVRGDRLRLALAGYDAGWPTVVRVGGIPASSRWYVDEVTAASYRHGREAGIPFDDGEGVLVGLPAPIPNPRSAADAVRWARNQVGGYAIWNNRCLNFVARAYGWDYSGVPYAIDHYWTVPSRMRHHLDRNAPRGALLFWDTGLRAGHVALSLGDGMIASNDVLTPGEIDVVPASLVEKRWGARYLGWTTPYFPMGSVD